MLNAPLCRTIFGMGGDGFHRFQTGSLGSTPPLVPQVPHKFLGFNHTMGSTGSMQVPWVQPRHWFHRIPDRFFGLKHAMVPQFQIVSLGSTTPLVSQVLDRFLGFNRGTVGIVEGVNHQTVVLFNVPPSVNQQWEPWSLGNLVSHSSCLPLILSPNNLRALFSIILSPVPLLLSFHLGSLHLFVFHYHRFVLSPMIPSPCFPSCCFPSFCGPLCNSHHHLFISSPIIPSS